MDLLAEKLGRVEGGRILDVATGRGSFVETLTETIGSFIEVVGIDTSAENIETAKKKFDNGKVRFEVMDASAMTFPDESFDTVTVANSLHHFSQVEPILDEMKRVLKPGGLFLIFEMFHDNLAERQLAHVELHHWWAEIDKLTGVVHNQTLVRQEIVQFAENLGLTDMEMFDYIEDRPAPPETIKELLIACDRYIAKTADNQAYRRLLEQGHRLKKRLAGGDFYWATELCILGRK